MKNLIFLLVTILSISSIQSCQKVINVDLDTAPPRLVIEANINWQKGTNGNNQKIKLSTTTSYFSSAFPAVSGAVVQVKNGANVVFSFLETIPNSGEYLCNNFSPTLNDTYTLTIVQNNQTYTATEKLMAVAPITTIVQNNNGGILGKKVEIKTFFNDPANADNFYLYNYKYSNQLKPDYYVDRDKFYQGNTFFSISRNSDLKTGGIIDVTHIGISQAYYNYLAILLDIAGSSGGGPFQSPPATVKGNVVNQSTFDNYPLGYFSLSESDTRTYIIQ